MLPGVLSLDGRFVNRSSKRIAASVAATASDAQRRGEPLRQRHAP
jgi:hypothetical protein